MICEELHGTMSINLIILATLIYYLIISHVYFKQLFTSTPIYEKKFIVTIIVRCIDKMLEGVLVRDNKKAQI